MTQPNQFWSLIFDSSSGAADAFLLQEGGVGGDTRLARGQPRRIGRPVVGPDLGDPSRAVWLPVDAAAVRHRRLVDLDDLAADRAGDGPDPLRALHRGHALARLDPAADLLRTDGDDALGQVL